jgi:hypothetical protein
METETQALARLEAAFSRYSTFLQRLQAAMKGTMFALQLHNPLDFPLTAKLSQSMRQANGYNFVVARLQKATVHTALM